MAKSYRKSNSAHVRLSNKLYHQAAKERNYEKNKLLFIKAAYHRSVEEAQQRYKRVLTQEEKTYIYNTHMRDELEIPATFHFSKK